MANRIKRALSPDHVQYANWIGGIVAAIATVAALFFGKQFNDESSRADDLDERVSQLNRANAKLETRTERDAATIEELQDQREALTAQVGKLQTKVSELQGQLPQEPTDESGALRNSAQVTLATEGDGLDLNSTEPDFGVSPDVGGEGALSLSGQDASLAAYFEGVDATEVDGAANYAKCSSATTYAEYYQADVTDLEEGNLCLRLWDSGRLAALKVVKRDSDTATFSIRVWDRE
jgi:cell division protein FtsB